MVRAEQVLLRVVLDVDDEELAGGRSSQRMILQIGDTGANPRVDVARTRSNAPDRSVLTSQRDLAPVGERRAQDVDQRLRRQR